MASARSMEITRQGKAFYESKLRSTLEATNLGDYVAIEPESGDYFLGKSLSEAIQSSRAAYPDRLPFATRVGEDTAVHIGVLIP